MGSAINDFAKAVLNSWNAIDKQRNKKDSKT